VRLTLEALEARRIEVRAVVLVGERHERNEGTLATWCEAPVLWVSRLEPLDRRAVESLAGTLDLARILPGVPS
jgi:hypothetical protein